MPLKKNFLLTTAEISFYFFPISLIAGSLIVNLNLIFFCLISIIYFFLNKIKFKINFVNFFLLLFFLALILSSYRNLNEIGTENFIKSIFLLKFYLLYLLLENFIKNTDFEFKYFFYVCFFSIIFLSLDLSLQYFNGKNILGFAPHDGRIAGVFGSEAVAGAFLQKIFIFSLIGSLFVLNPQNSFHSKIISGILALIIFGSFVASNRISFAILFTLFILLVFLFKLFRKNLIYSLIIIVPVFYYFFQNDIDINKKYSSFFIKANNTLINLIKSPQKVYEIESGENLSNSKNNTVHASLKSNHAKIYLTTIESFKERKYFGNGYKSFRTRCSVFATRNKNYLCSTHPHNYHLEVLHDTGILGFSLITLFTFALLIKFFTSYTAKEINYVNKVILGLLIINFLVEIFPLKSSGSLLTTWNGTLTWLTIALVNYGIYKKNEE